MKYKLKGSNMHLKDSQRKHVEDSKEEIWRDNSRELSRKKEKPEY